MNDNHDLPPLNDELPITINVSNELHELLPNTFHHFKSACNKLAAQLNFQTMTANWYHDEKNILDITIELVTPSAYQHHLSLYLQQKTLLTEFTDDVFLQKKHQSETNYLLFIALTEQEQQLLNSHRSLCNTLTEKKLVKVINLLADYLAISTIDH